MSITVRFSTGLAVTYREANFLVQAFDGKMQQLYTNSDKKNFVAAVPVDAIVEFYSPSRIEHNGKTPDQAAALLLDDIRQVSPSNLVKLKRLLQQFDARQWRWKA